MLQRNHFLRQRRHVRLRAVDDGESFAKPCKLIRCCSRVLLKALADPMANGVQPVRDHLAHAAKTARQFRVHANQIGDTLIKLMLALGGQRVLQPPRPPGARDSDEDGAQQRKHHARQGNGGFARPDGGPPR